MSRICVRDAVKLPAHRRPGRSARVAHSTPEGINSSASSKLFREETDVREPIKLKAIYELLETIARQAGRANPI